MNVHRPIVQYSFAEAVVVLTTSCIIIGSMWSQSVLHLIALTVAMFMVIANVVIVIVGQKEWRTFAIGFVVMVICYSALLVVVERKVAQSTEIPLRGYLPTTALWYSLKEPLTRQQFFMNDAAIPTDKNPTLANDNYTVLDGDGNKIGKLASGGIKLVKTPTSDQFEMTGYAVWYLLLGYLGGKFAVGFQRFQNNQETALQPSE